MKAKNQVVLRLGYIQILLPHSPQLGALTSLLVQGVECRYFPCLNNGNVEVLEPIEVTIIQLPAGTQFVARGVTEEAAPEPRAKSSRKLALLPPG